MSPASLSLEHFQNPVSAVATSQIIQSAQVMNVHAYNAPITIVNNTYHVALPEVQLEKKDSFCKWTIVRNVQRIFGKKSGVLTAAESISNQAENFVSQVRAGIESLNLRGCRYVTAVDMGSGVIDEVFDTPTRPEIPDANLLGYITDFGQPLSTRTSRVDLMRMVVH